MSLKNKNEQNCWVAKYPKVSIETLLCVFLSKLMKLSSKLVFFSPIPNMLFIILVYVNQVWWLIDNEAALRSNAVGNRPYAKVPPSTVEKQNERTTPCWGIVVADCLVWTIWAAFWFGNFIFKFKTKIMSGEWFVDCCVLRIYICKYVLCIENTEREALW